MIKKYSIIIVTFLFIIFLTECASYTAVLKNVEKNKKLEEKVKTYKMEGILKIPGSQSDPNEAYYEDNIISIKFMVPPQTYNSIHFILTNKTENNMKLLWDEAVLIDIDGNTNRITHSTVIRLSNLNELNKQQLPSIIASKSSLNRYIFCVDKIYLDQDGRPHIGDIFPQEPDNNTLRSLVGKDFKIILPLQIENDVYEYKFIFQITDAKY
ncbi:MAG: hypothetical protein GYA16_00100 [Spirochaetes bacterium]|nr:hypothetical protein [Spirochaetota bacterium]